MLVPPISGYLDASILSILGMQVKPSNGCRITVHPTCGGRMYLYDDSFTGTWCQCTTPACHFKGDLIELYQNCRNKATPYEALSDLRQQGCDVDNIRPEAYTAARLQWRLISTFFSDLRRSQPSGEDMENWMAILQRWNIYAESNIQRSPGMIYASKAVLDQLPFEAHWTWLEGNPRGKKAPAVLIPCYDMPTRIRGFFALGRSAIYYCGLTLATQAASSVYGLARTDTFSDDPEQVVYITDNLLGGLLIQRRAEIFGSQPLAIVRAGNTDNWGGIRKRTVVFWTNKLSDEYLLELFMRSPVTHVAEFDPVCPDNGLQPHTVHCDIISYMGEILTHQRPILREIAVRLANPAPGDNLLAAVSCDVNGLRRRLLEVMSPDDHKQLLNRCMQALPSAIVRSTAPDIVERDDGYYLGNARISNMRLHIDYEFCYGDCKQLKGMLIVDDKEVPILTEYKTQGLYNVLLKKAAVSGLPTPTSTKKYCGQGFYEIATKLWPPKTVVVPARMGWDADTESYNFPRIRIRGGQLEPVAEAPRQFPWRSLDVQYLPDTPERAYDIFKALAEMTTDTLGFWQLFILVVHNMIATERKFAPVGIGLVTPAGCEPMTDPWLRDVMGLEPVPLSTHTPPHNSHNIPQWFSVLPALASRTIGRLLQSNSPINGFVHVSDPMMLVGRLYRGWTFVRLGTQGASVEQLTGRMRNLQQAWSLLPVFLAYHQRLPAATYGQPLADIVSEIRGWLQGIAASPTLSKLYSVIGEAYKLLLGTLMDPQETPMRFVELAVTMHMRKKDVLVVDDKEVRIIMVRLVRALLLGGCPPPPNDIVEYFIQQKLPVDTGTYDIRLPRTLWDKWVQTPIASAAPKQPVPPAGKKKKRKHKATPTARPGVQPLSPELSGSRPS